MRLEDGPIAGQREFPHKGSATKTVLTRIFLPGSRSSYDIPATFLGFPVWRPPLVKMSGKLQGHGSFTMAVTRVVMDVYASYGPTCKNVDRISFFPTRHHTTSLIVQKVPGSVRLQQERPTIVMKRTVSTADFGVQGIFLTCKHYDCCLGAQDTCKLNNVQSTVPKTTLRPSTSRCLRYGGSRVQDYIEHTNP